MKKITHYDAVIRFKENSEEENVTIKVDKDFDIETATDQQIKDDEDIFFYLDLPEEIGELMDEENKEDFIVLRAVPVFEDEPAGKYNIIKILNIPSDNFTEAFLNKIAGRETYTDKVIKEHIFFPAHIIDELQQDGIILNVGDEATLKGIEQEMDKNDCTYFRIVTS